MKWIYVAFGGAAGSVLRYAIALATRRVPPVHMPWGTLIVNIVGSLAIGFVMAFLAARGKLDTELRVGITVGLLGGFTTYSSFALDTVGLWEARNLGVLSAYLAATLVLGVIACALGIVLGRAVA